MQIIATYILQPLEESLLNTSCIYVMQNHIQWTGLRWPADGISCSVWSLLNSDCLFISTNVIQIIATNILQPLEEGLLNTNCIYVMQNHIRWTGLRWPADGISCSVWSLQNSDYLTLFFYNCGLRKMGVPSKNFATTNKYVLLTKHVVQVCCCIPLFLLPYNLFSRKNTYL